MYIFYYLYFISMKFEYANEIFSMTSMFRFSIGTISITTNAINPSYLSNSCN
ncbi:hypothetical protein SAMN02927900_02476 [Rhizobium mongolense subsp. loessense]|uniref:Uncharacterized protein n=1 Tax=Rhizobium mongolense subsp. loessense TaxID=158890 RepID=A0A1G4RCV0_9HYPH|nr:hypothetical protein SAMN02927900_02476 [Rhizobium mongolense subsp. loessense]